MASMIPTLAIFVVGFLAAFAGYSLFADVILRDRSRINRRIDEEFRSRLRKKVQSSALFQNLSQLSAEASESETGQTLGERLELLIEQSGLNLTSKQLGLLSCGSAMVLGLPAGLLTGNVLVGLIVAIAAAALPVCYVCRKRKKRLDKLLSQLPDAFDLMARAVRAGNTVWQAMLAVAREFEAPISAEFAYCHEMQNLGLPSDVALQELARRTSLIEMKILVEAITVQQQTGGNLGEIIDKLTQVVRERFRIWGKIKTLTAEGRLQALVLLALAPGLYLVILIMNYEYAKVLIEFNHSVMLIGTLTCEALGWLWIRKIVNFDF